MKRFTFLCWSLLSAIPLLSQPTAYPSSLTVAQDGSGQFKNIQKAVNAVHDLSQQQVTIHIKNCIYPEKLVIPSWKSKITLRGESKENTIISNNHHTGKPFPGGEEPLGRDQCITFTSYIVLVQGNDF